jgi:hypothetical protein
MTWHRIYRLRRLPTATTAPVWALLLRSLLIRGIQP